MVVLVAGEVMAASVVQVVLVRTPYLAYLQQLVAMAVLAVMRVQVARVALVAMLARVASMAPVARVVPEATPGLRVMAARAVMVLSAEFLIPTEPMAVRAMTPESRAPVVLVVPEAPEALVVSRVQQDQMAVLQLQAVMAARAVMVLSALP